MSWLTATLLIVIGYLIGSLPVAWWMTKLVSGTDLRRVGSGNIGVMNVMVNVARWVGGLVFLAEAGKALAMISLARAWESPEWLAALAALAAFVGTRWMIWLGWVGGRGNTLAGAALLALSWQTLAVTLVLWILVRLISRNSFIATRVSLLCIPGLLGLITGSWPLALVGMAFILLFLTTHRRETDDHLLIKSRWSSFQDFLTSPPRKIKEDYPPKEDSDPPHSSSG